MNSPQPATPSPSEQYGTQPGSMTTPPQEQGQQRQPVPPTVPAGVQQTHRQGGQIRPQQPLQNRRGLLLFGFVAVLVIVLIIALIVSQTHNPPVRQGDGLPQTTGDLTRTMHVGEHALLTIRTHGGDVSVHSAHTDQFTIVPRSHDHNDEEYFKDVKVLYDQGHDAHGHDHITVTTNPWFKNVDFAVTIPDDAMVEVNVGSGSIDVHGGSGVNVTTGSGSLDFDTIQGPVTAHTDSGDITADTLNGQTTLESVSGSIKTTNTRGQLKATTTNGDVVVRQAALSGQSLLKTRNGSVRFDGSVDPHGSYTMQTTNGDVDATLPANTAFSLDAGTNSGSVQNDFGGTVVGSAPQAQLSLHTQNGSVIVTKAA